MIYYPALILCLPFALWAIFGNQEDSVWGDKWWNPNNSRNISYAIGWWVRNPCHNLTWHVIGIVGWPVSFTRIGKYPQDVFAPVEGWNFALILVSGWFPLPFISYWSANLGKFYIGWRERGNFGIKCTEKLLIGVLLAAVSVWIIYYLGQK